jgi:hypothetical protein
LVREGGVCHRRGEGGIVIGGEKWVGRANMCGYRFDYGTLGTFSQVCAYGTACLVEKID